MNEIRRETWGRLLAAAAGVMEENADLLCEMDGRMGDGDLGLTMKKCYASLPALYAAEEDPDMGKRLSRAGLRLTSVVPSTMGTLMASGWMEGGRRLTGAEAVDAAGYAAFLRGFAEGVAKRGKCAPGDRTVLDALLPAAESAERCAAAGGDLAATALSAWEGAKRGVEATRNMVPKYGKAAVFASRALGIEDQGAVAGALLLEGLWRGIAEAEEEKK